MRTFSVVLTLFWLFASVFSTVWLCRFYIKFRTTPVEVEVALAITSGMYAHAKHVRDVALDLDDPVLCREQLVAADRLTLAADRAVLHTVTPRMFFWTIFTCGAVWLLVCVVCLSKTFMPS